MILIHKKTRLNYYLKQSYGINIKVLTRVFFVSGSRNYFASSQSSCIFLRIRPERDSLHSIIVLFNQAINQPYSLISIKRFDVKVIREKDKTTQISNNFKLEWKKRVQIEIGWNCLILGNRLDNLCVMAIISLISFKINYWSKNNIHGIVFKTVDLFETTRNW